MPFDAAAHAAVLQAELQKAAPGMHVDLDPGPDLAALSFVHPAHEATVLVVVEGPAAHVPMPTVLVAVVIGDWNDLRSRPDGGAAMFALNSRLMAGAIGLLPLNQDELAVAVCRRVPVDALPPGLLTGLVDDLIWDYARCSGWTDRGNQGAAPRSDLEPPRRRIITSLDEV